MELVSVVIPVYNRSKHIRRAVQSVLTQGHSELEVIVVDDASTDDTVAIVKDEARKDRRVRLIEEGQRSGAQAARNTGIRSARGVWIAFLDSDDYWLPKSLEERWRLRPRGRPAVIHSSWYLCYPDCEELQTEYVRPLRGRVFKDLLRSFGPMFQGMLVPKEALHRIGYLDERIISYQEWDTAVRLAKYYEFRFLPQATFVYDCRHADSISKNRTREAIGYEQVFMKQWFPILRFLGPEALSAHYRMAAQHYRRAGDLTHTRSCLTAAWFLWPLAEGSLDTLREIVGEGPQRTALRWLRRNLGRIPGASIE